MSYRSYLLAALLLSCGPRGGRQAVLEAVDITADLHHRAEAGLFLHDREPLVLQLYGPDAGFVGLQSDLGTVWVKAAAGGKVVVYMDRASFYSHWISLCEVSSSRVFHEWPEHPVL